MFFHTYILTKRGPFAKIWLAAHWDKKLTKHEVRLIDLSQTVVNIIEPSVPIALRTSGELMLGVVRVYGLKVRILLKEATDAAHDLLKKDNVTIVGTAMIKTVAKEAPSNVTHPEVLTKDLLLSAPTFAGTFDADFDAIAGLVMDKGLVPSTIKKGPKDVDLGEEWFQPQTSQYQEGLRNLSQEEFQYLNEEIASEKKRGRSEESVPLSEHSKKSGSSSIEALRKSRTPGQAPDPTSMVDIGQIAAPELDFLEVPVPKSPLPPPVAPFDEFEAPLPQAKKVKTGTKFNTVDTDGTYFDISTYKPIMEKPFDDVAKIRRHGPRTVEDAYRMQHMEDVDGSSAGLLGEGPRGAWDSMADCFARAVAQRKPWLAVEGGRGEGSAKPVPGTIPEVDMNAPPQLPEFDLPPLPPMGDDAGFPALADPRSPPKGRDTTTSTTSEATLTSLRSASNSKGVVVFRTMVKGKKRMEVSRAFADVLVLASLGQVQVRQEKPFGELYVTPVPVS